MCVFCFSRLDGARILETLRLWTNKTRLLCVQRDVWFHTIYKVRALCHLNPPLLPDVHTNVHNFGPDGRLLTVPDATLAAIWLEVKGRRLGSGQWRCKSWWPRCVLGSGITGLSDQKNRKLKPPIKTKITVGAAAPPAGQLLLLQLKIWIKIHPFPSCSSWFFAYKSGKDVEFWFCFKLFLKDRKLLQRNVIGRMLCHKISRFCGENHFFLPFLLNAWELLFFKRVPLSMQFKKDFLEMSNRG